jgi:hypothetical protein
MSYKIYHYIQPRLISLKGLFFLCLICLGVFSCKKNMNAVDTLQSRFDTGMVSYVQGSNVVALNGVNYSFTPYYMGVPVTLKESAKTADTITAAVDPSLISEYNQIYLEKNPTIPQGAFEVAHQGAFAINAGTKEATDSLYVLLNDGSQLKDSTVYLVPVTLSAKKGSKLKYSLFFFKVLVTKGDLQAKTFGSTLATGISNNRLVPSGGLQVVLSGITLPDEMKIRMSLNKVFPAHDVIVQATMLTQSEISAAITKETFVGIPVPEANATLIKDLVTIPARLMLSKDSVTVRFNNKNQLTAGWYVTGVKIKTYTGSAYGVPPVANDSCRAYIRFFKNN